MDFKKSKTITIVSINDIVDKIFICMQNVFQAGFYRNKGDFLWQ